jgi:hypothetical protein
MYANLFLVLGLLDTGHMVGVTDASQQFGFYHQVQSSFHETHTTDAVEGNLFLAKEKNWYAASGLKLGLERHYKSVLYDRQYAVVTPKLSIGTRRPDINFAVGLEFGKAFWSLTKDRVGRDVKGYNDTTSALFSVSLNVDKFLNSK